MSPFRRGLKYLKIYFNFGLLFDLIKGITMERMIKRWANFSRLWSFKFSLLLLMFLLEKLIGGFIQMQFGYFSLKLKKEYMWVIKARAWYWCWQSFGVIKSWKFLGVELIFLLPCWLLTKFCQGQQIIFANSRLFPQLLIYLNLIDVCVLNRFWL